MAEKYPCQGAKQSGDRVVEYIVNLSHDPDPLTGLVVSDRRGPLPPPIHS